MQQFKKVTCPNVVKGKLCGRTLSHYLEGTDSVYRSICPKCGETIIIYSAGKTMLANSISISIEIKF